MKATVSDVLKRYGQQYLDQFACSIPAQQKKVLRAVMACREETLGTIRYRCISCGSDHTLPRSCCNRHCAACQHQRTQLWLEKQQDRLLPCDYFLITFTVPQELRAFVLSHPEQSYRAMMSAAAQTLKTAATNERHVGACETGFFGVLHTWGRDLSYHPHVHFVVPSGGIGNDGQWKPSRPSVFVPTQVLAVLFRNKLRDQLRAVDGFKQVDASVWQRKWTVDSKAVGDGRAALKYLAPYVIRGPVSNWRASWCNNAEKLDDAQLHLQVKRSGTKRYRAMPMTVTEFIRRWLLHVLPAGLHRVRHYGFLSGSSKRTIDELQLLIAVAMGRIYYLLNHQQIVMADVGQLACPHCGGAMVSLGYFPPEIVSISTLARAPP